MYKVEMKSSCLFCLMITFILYGTLFQMATCLLDVTKIISYMGYFNGYSEDHVALFIRVVCIISLQKIMEFFHI